jgi:ABC-type uncharacterized transport system permease subunit
VLFFSDVFLEIGFVVGGAFFATLFLAGLDYFFAI